MNTKTLTAWREAHDNHVRFVDVSLFVKVIGHGYPMVLMHGGPSLDHTTLLPLQPLADQFTLIFYDHRCNGRSEGAEVTSMTWENLTADADALRQALGFDKWAVLGHSFGGNVALEYALRYPQSLSHLILMNTGGDQWWVNQNAPGDPGKTRLQRRRRASRSPFLQRPDDARGVHSHRDEVHDRVLLPHQPAGDSSRRCLRGLTPCIAPKPSSSATASCSRAGR